MCYYLGPYSTLPKRVRTCLEGGLNGPGGLTGVGGVSGLVQGDA